MYVFERFIGVLIHAIVLILMCSIVAKTKKRNIGKVLFIYTLILTIMAYFYIPGTTADLYRLTSMMNNWSILNFTDFKHILLGTSTPMSYLYIYSIGKIGNDHLLPAITAFIYYSNVFYILKKYTYSKKISSNVCAITLLFIMSSAGFVGVISGIRNHLAFSIIAVCIYKEIMEKKPIVYNIPFYIIAALMHNAALVLVAIRFLVLIIQKKRKTYQQFLLLIVSVIIMAIVVKYGAFYLDSVFEKANVFITNNVYTNIWGYMITILQLMVVIWLQTHIKHSSDNENGLIELSVLVKVLIVISLIFSFEYNIFARFISFIMIINIPIVLKLIEPNYKIKTKKMHKVILSVSLIMLLIGSARGSLSGLKFFIL